MKTLELHQGSKEWHAVRTAHFTASEAPAMMGISKYMTRDELLALKKFGIEEDITAYKQQLFDRGHAVEAAIRPVIEELIGEPLYPVTGQSTVSDLPLLASFDGLTMMEDIIFEHKLWNEELARSVAAGEVPESHRPQLDQQLLVSGAAKVIFVVSDGTKENMVYCEYLPDQARFNNLIAGWQQFQKDLETFVLPQQQEIVAANAIAEFPTLSIIVSGSVQSSNLATYEEAVASRIRAINTDLQTDQDFADAEETVKFLKKGEEEIQLIKKQILGQTADIDQAFKTMDRLSEEMRQKRLSLDKLVKAEKDQRKADIIVHAERELTGHIQECQEEMQGCTLPQTNANFAAAAKGKSKLSSIQSAVNTALANAKIEVNEYAKVARANLGYLDEMAKEYRFLFNDLQQLINKDNTSFAAIVDNRIAQHKQTELQRLEAERKRIAEEERSKAEAAAAKAVEAEQKHITEEENRKTEAQTKQHVEPVPQRKTQPVTETQNNPETLRHDIYAWIDGTHLTEQQRSDLVAILDKWNVQ